MSYLKTNSLLFANIKFVNTNFFFYSKDFLFDRLFYRNIKSHQFLILMLSHIFFGKKKNIVIIIINLMKNSFANYIT